MRYVLIDLGAWAQDCGHLSFEQEGVYWRMLVWVYTHERPLPESIEHICKIIYTPHPDDAPDMLLRVRNAVSYVLAHYWEVGKLFGHVGFVNRKASEVIKAFRSNVYSNQPEAIKKRLQRERRRQRDNLTITKTGKSDRVNGSWKKSTERHREGEIPGTNRDMSPNCPPCVPLPIKGSKRTNTAGTQAHPLAGASAPLNSRGKTPSEPQQPTRAANPAAILACAAMRGHGIKDVDPFDARLLDLLRCGATRDQLAFAAAQAAAEHAGFDKAMSLALDLLTQQGPKSARQAANGH